MSNRLSLTRNTKPGKNELFFYVKDSHGNTIEIKQTITEIKRGQVRFDIATGEKVKILRGELISDD